MDRSKNDRTKELVLVMQLDLENFRPLQRKLGKIFSRVKNSFVTFLKVEKKRYEDTRFQNLTHVYFVYKFSESSTVLWGS